MQFHSGAGGGDHGFLRRIDAGNVSCAIDAGRVVCILLEGEGSTLSFGGAPHSGLCGRPAAAPNMDGLGQPAPWHRVSACKGSGVRWLRYCHMVPHDGVAATARRLSLQMPQGGKALLLHRGYGAAGGLLLLLLLP